MSEYTDLHNRIRALELRPAEAAYTPTFTGFGVAASINFRWVRVGNRLKIMGVFTLGTPTAVEARISLPGTLVADTLIQTLQLCGMYTANAGGAYEQPVLIEPSVGYLTFGTHTGGSAGLAKRNGNGLGLASGNVMSLFCEIPIAGWNG